MGLPNKEVIMKVNIEIDLTPEEARALIGLPNYSQMHETWLNMVKSKMEETAPSADIEPMLKAWTSMGNSMGGLATDAMNTFFNAVNAAASDIDVKVNPKKTEK